MNIPRLQPSPRHGGAAQASDQAAATPSGSAFRPDVQGLRAVAVILVLIYHLHPTALPAGFVGVDVFFVISGFLITGHLARDHERHGRIRLLDFWGRRARRLLPAAALVLIVTWIGSRILLPATRLPAAAEQIRASALYYQNWLLASRSVNYLTASDAPSPVQHYWSLSVEEQFYLGWPLLFLVAALLTTYGLRRAGRVAPIVIAGGIVAASLTYSAYLTHADPGAAYFVTTTRIWELALGGLLALAPAAVRSVLGRQGWLAWTGLVAIGLSAVLISGTAAFPGTIALVPVGGAVLLLACGGPAAGRGTWRLMSLRPLVFFGDISYSLYLWHWPLIVLWSAHTGHRIGIRSGIGIAVVSVLLAWLTKILVEDPVRRSRLIAARPRRMLATTAVLAVPLVAVLFYTPPQLHTTKLDAAHQGAAADVPTSASSSPFTSASPAAIPPSPLPLIAVAAQDFAPYSQCETTPSKVKARPCFYGDRQNPRLRIMLIGDSVANQYRTILIKVAKARHWLLITDLHSQCPWTATMTVLNNAPYTQCHDWGVQTLHDTLTKYHPDVVITSARPVLGTVSHPAADPVSFGQIAKGMDTYWRQLAAHGTKIIAVRESPEPGRNVPDCLSRPGATLAACTAPASTAIVKQSPLQQAVSAMPTQAELLDVDSHICTGQVCPPIVGNVVVYRDTHHMTLTYINSLEPYFIRRLLATRALRGR